LHPQRAEDALDRLLERGGFPEPLLAQDAGEADRWRRQYLEDLIREDVVEFSRIHEVRAMRVFVEMLRERVGSPLSLASIARDLQVSPTTLAKYLDILEALYVVFTVRPYRNTPARSPEPKVYFFDTGCGRRGRALRERLRGDASEARPLPAGCRRSAATLHYVRE
jgi:predicted AAA+ superfamily ATPase